MDEFLLTAQHADHVEGVNTITLEDVCCEGHGLCLACGVAILDDAETALAEKESILEFLSHWADTATYGQLPEEIAQMLTSGHFDELFKSLLTALWGAQIYHHLRGEASWFYENISTVVLLKFSGLFFDEGNFGANWAPVMLVSLVLSTPAYDPSLSPNESSATAVSPSLLVSKVLTKFFRKFADILLALPHDKQLLLSELLISSLNSASQDELRVALELFHAVLCCTGECFSTSAFGETESSWFKIVVSDDFLRNAFGRLFHILQRPLTGVASSEPAVGSAEIRQSQNSPILFSDPPSPEGKSGAFDDDEIGNLLRPAIGFLPPPAEVVSPSDLQLAVLRVLAKLMTLGPGPNRTLFDMFCEQDETQTPLSNESNTPEAKSVVSLMALKRLWLFKQKQNAELQLGLIDFCHQLLTCDAETCAVWVAEIIRCDLPEVWLNALSGSDVGVLAGCFDCLQIIVSHGEYSSKARTCYGLDIVLRGVDHILEIAPDNSILIASGFKVAAALIAACLLVNGKLLNERGATLEASLQLLLTAVSRYAFQCEEITDAYLELLGVTLSALELSPIQVDLSSSAHGELRSIVQALCNVCLGSLSRQNSPAALSPASASPTIFLLAFRLLVLLLDLVKRANDRLHLHLLHQTAPPRLLLELCGNADAEWGDETVRREGEGESSESSGQSAERKTAPFERFLDMAKQNELRITADILIDMICPPRHVMASGTRAAPLIRTLQQVVARVVDKTTADEVSSLLDEAVKTNNLKDVSKPLRTLLLIGTSPQDHVENSD